MMKAFGTPIGRGPYLALAATLLVAAMADPAASCSCAVHETLAEKVEHAGNVFLGEVRSVTAEEREQDDVHLSFTVYRFRVRSAWKGVRRDEVKVWVHEGMCAAKFELRATYIVYAIGSGRTLETSMCEGSLALEASPGVTSAEATAELEVLGEPKWRARE